MRLRLSIMIIIGVIIFVILAGAAVYLGVREDSGKNKKPPV